ncbi:PLDc N-terminal domain-containing protein [Luteolibacter sp. LG18]|uniref:PLDc N-terminal domain-containing protein n=1 Tax=Luteolibacter sp. LG18 TaxID=2819286 RepID=UPI002B308D1A|nr:hypothetical protein llg_13460 [Luteolibacter sp. LG18]
MGAPELLFIFLGVLPLILSIIALVQCLGAEFRDPNNKIIWVLVILLAPIVGSILWWAIGRNQRRLG